MQNVPRTDDARCHPQAQRADSVDRSHSNTSLVDDRRKPYPSDVDQRQWRLIAGCLPQQRRLGRPRSTDLREVVNAVNYRWTTGCTWRMLPHDFPPWETVYTYFREWQCNGTLQELRRICLQRNARPASSAD